MPKENIINNVEIKNMNIINNSSTSNNLLLLKKFENFIKIVIIISSLIFFCRNYLLLSSKKEIIIDNKLNLIKEDNMDFSQYSSSIKTIEFYYPKIHILNEKNEYREKILNDKNIANKLKEQINLAKNHGIYGLGFYYFWSSIKNVFNDPLDIIISNPDLNIKFILIWQNNDFFGLKNYLYNNMSDFFIAIKKYIIDERYIKINNK